LEATAMISIQMAPQCTNPDCKKWTHEDCTSRDESGLLMCPCGVTFQ
jgi:hypothetical protein